MAETDLQGDSHYIVRPGYLAFSLEETHMTTVVADGLVVCIWDSTLACGGMSHFMHPMAQCREEATPVFGNAATIGLINLGEAAGCLRKDLGAHILGGTASPSGKFHDIGERNAQVARKVLAHKGIRIISEDIGGTVARKILFNTFSGELAVLKVSRVRETDWVIKPSTVNKSNQSS